MPEIEFVDESELTEEELKAKRMREKQREFANKRKEAIVNMIKSQTNYTEEEIESKTSL